MFGKKERTMMVLDIEQKMLKKQEFRKERDVNDFKKTNFR